MSREIKVKMNRWVLPATIIATFVGAGFICYLLPSNHKMPDIKVPAIKVPSTRLSCGPAALMTIAQILGQDITDKLCTLLIEDQRAKKAIVSFYDLTQWAKIAGMEPTGLKINPADLSELSLPAIVHLKENHFMTLVAVNSEQVILMDECAIQRRVSRKDFDKRFSGNVLCFWYMN